jgi:hypothetical protein
MVCASMLTDQHYPAVGPERRPHPGAAPDLRARGAGEPGWSQSDPGATGPDATGPNATGH